MGPCTEAGASSSGLLRQLPDGVEESAVDPLHDGDGAGAEAGLLGLAAADALHVGLDVLNRSQRFGNIMHGRFSPGRVDSPGKASRFGESAEPS